MRPLRNLSVTAFALLGVLAVAAVTSTVSAQAQDWPTKPVTIISPAAAGNSPDVTMRVVADRLTQIWKQQIVMLNRPGAGGLIAAQAAAAPGIEKDGYTLYMTQASTYTVLPVTMEGKMPVDLQTAFVPIGLVGVQPIGVGVNAALPVKTLPEMLELVRKTAGRHAVRRHQSRRAIASHRRTAARAHRRAAQLRACRRARRLRSTT